MGKPPGVLVLAILAALKRHDELTRAEICMVIGVPKLKAASAVSRLNKPLRMCPKRIYVVRYVYDDDTGGRFYPRAVYALGNKRDAARPSPLSAAECSRRWRETERYKVNSVFQWAQPRKVRHAERRGTGQESMRVCGSK